MRFALAGFNHETNTFHSIPTEYENFEKSVMLRGEEINKLYETPSSVGGGANDILQGEVPKIAGGANNIYLKDNTPV